MNLLDLHAASTLLSTSSPDPVYGVSSVPEANMTSIALTLVGAALLGAVLVIGSVVGWNHMWESRRINRARISAAVSVPDRVAEIRARRAHAPAGGDTTTGSASACGAPPRRIA